MPLPVGQVLKWVYAHMSPWGPYLLKPLHLSKNFCLQIYFYNFTSVIFYLYIIFYLCCKFIDVKYTPKYFFQLLLQLFSFQSNAAMLSPQLLTNFDHYFPKFQTVDTRYLVSSNVVAHAIVSLKLPHWSIAVYCFSRGKIHVFCEWKFEVILLYIAGPRTDKITYRE